MNEYNSFQIKIKLHTIEGNLINCHNNHDYFVI